MSEVIDFEEVMNKVKRQNETYNNALKERIIRTLRFYADYDNYIFTGEGYGTVLPPEDKHSKILHDMGDEARQLLRILGEFDV